MLKAQIQVEDGGDLHKIFLVEDRDFGNDRAGYDVKLKNGVLTIEVFAKDSTALRSVLNTVTKIMTVYEKTSSALEK